MTTRATLFPRLLAAAFAALTATSIAAPARASLGIGAEVSPDFVLGSTANTDNARGFGFAARLGYKLPIPLLKITPEGKLAYDRLPAFDATLNTFRAMAGARVAVDLFLIAPTVFAHYGYGRYSGSSSMGDVSAGGQAIDVGAGVDLTMIPVIDLGVFLSINRVSADQGNLTWLAVGAQAVIGF
jgi:hypothetical protein